MKTNIYHPTSPERDLTSPGRCSLPTTISTPHRCTCREDNIKLPKDNPISDETYQQMINEAKQHRTSQGKTIRDKGESNI